MMVSVIDPVSRKECGVFVNEGKEWMRRLPIKKTLGTMVAIMVATILIGPFTADPALAGEKTRDIRFIAYDNGTVFDTRTNLMWAAKDNGVDIDWSGAKSYCDNYRGGDYTDWRMPTQDDLAALYDAAKNYKSDCENDVHLTELIRLTCTWAWASEKRGSDAAFFYFGSGHRGWSSQSIDTYFRALLVRSGK
jgi:Protein of unknown function (DUF1566)